MEKNMKKVNGNTLYQYSFLSDLKANEKGDKAVFIRKTANEERNTYDSNLYLLYEKGRLTKITACNKVREAFWLDNERVAFVSEREAEESRKVAKATQNKEGGQVESVLKDGQNEGAEEKELRLFVKNLNEPTESEFLCSLRGSISSIDCLADGRLIYLKERKITEAEDPFFGAQENEEGYMRIRRIPFYSDGGSFDFHKKSTLCIFDPSSGKEKELSVPDYAFFSYTLSADRSKLLILATKIEKVYRPQVAIFEYILAEDRLSEILDDQENNLNETYSIYMACYLGEVPFFLGSTMKKHGLNENQLPHIIEDGELKILNGEDIDYFNSGVQDMILGGGKEYKVFKDRIEILTTFACENRILRIYGDGRMEEVFSFDGSISCFDYVEGKPVFVGLTEDRGQELYVEGIRVSDFHKFLEDFYVALPQHFTVESTGVTIDGFVLLPEDYEKREHLPAVLEIHGGPKVTYQKTYFHEMQMLVAEGYVVMYCNPRGSAGKGNEFLDIFGSYGTVDYQNIMEFCDEALKKYPKIDAKRLFVTGGSYGGYMSNHIVSRTNRFRAAVTQRSISNWTSMYGCSDIGYYFSTDQHRIQIEDEAFWKKLWEVSPLKYADRVKTPTLILHSEHDFRCPLEQGYQFFTALLHRGVDSELMIFKEESHGLSREGKPKNRIARLEAIREWFRKYDE